MDAQPLGELRDHPDVREAVGDEALDYWAGRRPDELILLAAIRGAKSRFSVASAWKDVRTCDVSGLASGEIPRFSIVSLYKDNAQATYEHLVGTVLAQPWMRAQLLKEPKSGAMLVKHITGRPVEIRVVAGARAGNTLVSRWSAGVAFDEAPRMASADAAVINYDHLYDNVQGRLLRGARIYSPGSPWAPFGPIYERVQAQHKRAGGTTLIVRARGPAMNPVHWTPERMEKLKATNPDAYITDCLAEFGSPEENLYTDAELSRCIRPRGELPAQERCQYVAAMDPATRGNSWTLIIAHREGRKLIVDVARQWTGSKLAPLSPNETIGDIAAICRDYRVATILSDQWFGDALEDIARMHGLGFYQKDMGEQERIKCYMNFKVRLGERLVDLPNEPMLREDLVRVVRKPKQNGVAVVLPKTPDGRHCDFVPSTILALSDYLADVSPEPDPDHVREAKAMKEAAKRAMNRSKSMYVR